MLRVERVGPPGHDAQIQRWTMADPARRNVLGTEMVRALGAAIADAGECRTALLRAQGPVWCAGFDLRELPEDASPAVLSHLEALFTALEQAPFPIIAVVTGGAWGGGCELAMACDLIVAEASARFALTPARLGVAYPESGLARALAVLPPAVVRELVYTAEPITAARAYELGMVNALAADPQEAMTRAQALAEAILAGSAQTIVAAKADIAALLNGGGHAAERDALRAAAWGSADFRSRRSALLARLSSAVD